MTDDTNYMENNDEIPYMRSLSLCINKMVKDGYEDDFKVVDNKLKSLKTEQNYNPDQVNVVNFYRFEGQSDPNDNAILYVIETSDGLKGTLADAYGAYSDAKVTEFFKNVEIHKKTNSADNEKRHS